MAIKRNSGGGKVIFVDLKGKVQDFIDDQGKQRHGALVISHGKDQPKEVLPSNSAVSGFVTDIDVHTGSYEGEEINSLRVRIEDENHEEPPVVLSFALGSFFGAKLVGLLNAADLSKPLVIAANTVKAGEKIGDKVSEKDNVFPTMRQSDVRLVASWVNADGQVLKELPKPNEITVNKKVIKDMEEINGIVGTTIQALYAKVDALKERPVGDDDGISASEVDAAASQEQVRQRA